MVFIFFLDWPYQGKSALGIKNDLIVFGCSQDAEQSVWRQQYQD